MGEAELAMLLSGEAGRLEKILTGLEKDGLVIREGGRLRIA
jgi:hypothetical protein